MDSEIQEIKTHVESTSPEAAALSATLYLRGGVSGAVQRRQAAIRDRFDLARGADRLLESRVERWAPRVVTPVADAEPDSVAAVETYRDLAAAVDAAGGRLHPFFQVRDRPGGLLTSGPEGERIIFPVACLVVRRDDQVTGLYPCWLDGTHFSVEAGLESLASGDPENLS